MAELTDREVRRRANGYQCYTCEDIIEGDDPPELCDECDDAVQPLFILACPNKVKRGDLPRCESDYHHYGYGDRHVIDLDGEHGIAEARKEMEVQSGS